MKSAQEIAEIIGIPLDEWPGRCYEIAGQLLAHKLVTDEDAELRYGHWLGPVSTRCVVESWISAPFARHGWIEAGARIIDPTRWVFEARRPYIYEGRSDHYDMGGNVLRASMEQPCPAYDPDAPRSKLAVWKVCPMAHRFVMGELFGGAPGVTQHMARWLGNLALPRLTHHAHPIYTALVAAGETATIPIDNYRAVLGDDPQDTTAD